MSSGPAVRVDAPFVQACVLVLRDNLDGDRIASPETLPELTRCLI